MARHGWHILREGPVLTLARRLPVRFDLVAEADFAPGRRLRLASQIRQDMWRKLQGLRGFSPVVEVTQTEIGLHVRAGGALPKGPNPAYAVSQLETLLADPALRARWQRGAA